MDRLLTLAPDVSTAIGWRMKRLPIIANFAIFLTSVASATHPAASAARVSFKKSRMLTHLASQLGQRPCQHGFPVIPSSRFPSTQSMPDGSCMNSIPAAERPHQTTSLSAEWRCMRPALKRQDKGCVTNALLIGQRC